MLQHPCSSGCVLRWQPKGLTQSSSATAAGSATTASIATFRKPTSAPHLTACSVARPLLPPFFFPQAAQRNRMKEWRWGRWQRQRQQGSAAVHAATAPTSGGSSSRHCWLSNSRWCWLSSIKQAVQLCIAGLEAIRCKLVGRSVTFGLFKSLHIMGSDPRHTINRLVWP